MNIVIIGAGPAGLACGYKLLKNNKNITVTIIDESSQVGGISKTIKYHNNKMDLGGHRFFTKNEEVKKFWLELLPLQTEPAYDDIILEAKKDFSKGRKKYDPEKKDKIMLLRNRISRIYYNKKFFDYPVNFNMKTIKSMGIINSFKCGFSYLKTIFVKKKEINLENFYINRFGYHLYSMFFKDYTTKLWGRTPKEIDASWGSQRVKGISVHKVLIDYIKRIFKVKDKKKETSLIESFYYPKNGPGELYEVLASKIEELGGKIILNSRVEIINNKNSEIKSISYRQDKIKKEIDCDMLISSMPIKDLVNGMRKVPKRIKDISNNLPYRDFIIVGVLLPKLDIPKDKKIKTIHGSVGDNWIYIQDKDVKVGRIQVFNNWSPYLVNKPKDNIWLGLEYFCNENDNFWNLSDNKIKELAYQELKKMNISLSKPIDSCVVRVKKAYPAYFDSYDNINSIYKYLEKYQNLYCIGRNGTHSYNNMDHSIVSGFICADMIKNKDHDLIKLWKVNTDSTYQEMKS